MDAQSNGMALLLADTDQTQAYVFESSKLPEIRGASGQLDDLNETIGRWVEQTEGGERIYADGGTLLALAPAEHAPDLASRIEAAYPEETGAATITAVSPRCPEG